MAQISALTGREYHLFNYTGAADAERVIIAMGSVCDTVREVVDTLNAAGEKVGLLSVHLFRPFRWPTFSLSCRKPYSALPCLTVPKSPALRPNRCLMDVKMPSTTTTTMRR